MENVLVTFVSDYKNNTGFAQAFFNLHSSLLQYKKCDKIYVYVVGKDGEEEVINNQIYVRYIPKQHLMKLLEYKMFRGIKNSSISRKISKYLSEIQEISKKSNLQMILVESMFIAWLIPILAKKLPEEKIVCRIHGTGPEYTAFYKQIEDYNFRKYLLECVFSNKYIAVTTKFYIDFFSDYYRDYSKFMDKEFFVLPNTCNSKSSLFVNDTKDLGYVTFMQLGRIDFRGYHQKGFQDTVKALMYIEENHPEVAKKIRVVSIGNGDMLSQYLDKMSKLKYVKYEHFEKKDNSEVKDILMKSDVVLMPSRCEGMSMFATEAISYGKPLIATEGNGLESVCEDGYNALMMRPYDYIGLANKMMYFVLNVDKISEFSRNSAKFYDDNYSYEKTANKYEVIVNYLGGK